MLGRGNFFAGNGGTRRNRRASLQRRRRGSAIYSSTHDLTQCDHAVNGTRHSVRDVEIEPSIKGLSGYSRNQIGASSKYDRNSGDYIDESDVNLRSFIGHESAMSIESASDEGSNSILRLSFIRDQGDAYDDIYEEEVVHRHSVNPTGGIRERETRRSSSRISVTRYLGEARPMISKQNVNSVRGLSTATNYFDSSPGCLYGDKHDDNDDWQAALNKRLEEEFPENREYNMKTILESTLRELKAGDWVEVQGGDLIWRLSMIGSVIKSQDMNEGTVVSFYKIGSAYVDESHFRVSEIGLRRLFGSGPWIWQQWALLKLEHILRFQIQHRCDFEEFETLVFVEALWDNWLSHEDNDEFRKLFDDARIGKMGRKHLEANIFTPFEEIAKVSNIDHRWNFETTSVSVYSYLSILGQGSLIPLLAFFLQIGIPIVLASSIEDQEVFKQEVGVRERIEAFYCGSSETDEGEMCKLDYFLARSMVFLMVLLYMIQVQPAAYSEFRQVVGYETDTALGRLKGVRRLVRLQLKGRILQRIGDVLDSFMNTSYVYLLYGLNILNILKNASPLDTLLNSLALEFVFQIDESISGNIWFDSSKRYIMAGAIELIIQEALDTESLMDLQLFSAKYNVPEKTLLEACSGDHNIFWNKSQAKIDVEDVRFMSKGERIDHETAQIAREKHNFAAYEDLVKSPAHFSIRLWKKNKGGTFNHFKKLRTWSRWDKVLFIFDVPNLNNIFDNERGLTVLDELGREEVIYKDIGTLHYNGNDDLFFWHFIDVITFNRTFRLLKAGIRRSHFGNYRLIALLAHELIEWPAYLLTLLFPAYLFSVFFMLPLCVFSNDTREEFNLGFFSKNCTKGS